MGDFSLAVLSLAACVLGASASAKLSSRKAYRSFSESLAKTRLLPEHLRSAGAAVLSWAEAAIAAGLVVADVLTIATMPGAILVAESALVAAACLVAVLAAGIAMVIRSGIRAPCACFGPGASRPLGMAHLVRNLSLLALVGVGLAYVSQAPRHPAASALLATGTGAVAALPFIRWDDLVDLFSPIQPSLNATSRARPDNRRD